MKDLVRIHSDDGYSETDYIIFDIPMTNDRISIQNKPDPKKTGRRKNISNRLTLCRGWRCLGRARGEPPAGG